MRFFFVEVQTRFLLFRFLKTQKNSDLDGGIKDVYISLVENQNN